MERKKVIIQILIITGITIGILIPGHLRLKELREENERYKTRIGLLEKQNDVLEKELVATKEDPNYI
ncbi:MAG: hypothetical protein ABH862_00240, partial [Candidatus Omnitrophota bacterium]